MTVTQSAPRRPPTWLRLSLYSTWFSACFALFFYSQFSSSMSALKGPLVAALEDALGKGKQGRYGTDPVVEIGKLSLWRGTGVSLERVRIQLASTDPDPGPTLELDELNLRLGAFALLLGDPKVEVSAELYGGSLSGAALLQGGKEFEDALYGDVRALLAGKADGLGTLTLELEAIDLAKAVFVQEKAKVPVTGMLGGTVDIDMGEKPPEEAKGKVDLAIRRVNLGPGELEIPLPGLTGGLTVPLVDLGDLEVQVKLDKGKGKTERIGLNGRDIQADVDADLDMSPRLNLSRLTGQGWFKISPEFLENNGKFKALLDFAGPLKKAQDKDGRYAFHMKGTLTKPGFQLGEERVSGGSRRKPRGRR